MTKTGSRRGIAMIELIFALVVMGIALMSAPMLIERSTRTSFVALQQESIAAAAVQIDMIMATEWDHWDTNGTIGEPVLKTDSTVFNQCASGEERPKGVTTGSGRYCIALGGPSVAYSATPPSALGPEGDEGGNSYNDIDDYDGQSYTVSVYNNEEIPIHQGDYIDQSITVTSSVDYGNDVPKYSDGTDGTYQTLTIFANPFREVNTSKSTNIKLISVTLTSSNPVDELGNKHIVLSSFMCNIGAPKNLVSNRGSLGL